MKKYWNRFASAGACLALLVLTACATATWLVPTLVTSAACLAIERQPQSAGYIEACGELFFALGTTNHAPTVAEVETALTNLPSADLTPAERRMVWNGVLLAYTGAYAAVKNNPDAQKTLSATLQGIGMALTDAVSQCGPQVAGVAKTKALRAMQPLTIDATGLDGIAQAVAQQIKARHRK